MTAPRWQRVKDVFYDATLRAPAERAAFLDAACEGDGELRREIDSLLASYQEAGPFLSRGPRLDTRADTGAADPPAAGRAIGPYRVQGVIGQGGMILKRGHELEQVLRLFDKGRFKVVD